MKLHIPITGDKALTLTIPGWLHLDAMAARERDPSLDCARRVGLVLLAVGLGDRTAQAPLQALARGRGLLDVAGEALDALERHVGPTGDTLDLVARVAAACMAPPVVRAPPAPVKPSAPVGPPTLAIEPVPDPYPGAMVDGETWLQFAERSRRKPQPEDAARRERWMEIDAEFAAKKGA